MSFKELFNNFYLKRLLMFAMIIVLIACSALVDWWWEQGKLGFQTFFVWFWLFGGTLGLCLLFSLALWHIGETAPDENKPWKKFFVIALILAIVGHNLVFLTYMMSVTLAVSPSLLFTIIMMSLLPAILPRHENTKRQILYVLLMVMFVVLPFMIGVSMFIHLSWLNPAEAIFTTLYWIFIWGFVMPAIYMTLAFGYRMGGGKTRHVFNIALAGTFMQYSLLEDLFFYLLTGTPLPATWPWLSNFIFPLEAIFLHPGIAISTIEMLIWFSIMTVISVIILFDIYGIIWDRYLKPSFSKKD